MLDDLQEMRGYCKLKEEALDRTLWRTGFGRGYEPAMHTTAAVPTLSRFKSPLVFQQFIHGAPRPAEMRNTSAY
jgi:hypothetical protein